MSDFSRCTISSCVAAALLAGCGGLQTPVAVTGTVPQNHAAAMHVDRSGSWMLPEAKNDGLLYVTNGCGGVCVLSYPGGSLVGSLAIPAAGSVCSDRDGDVFVTVSSLSNPSILEYRHGGTKPIEILNDSTNVPMGCSVDPTTGNLAVANFLGRGWGYDRGNVAIYEGARGDGTDVHQPGIYWYYFCAYDDNGNLLVDGSSESGPGDKFAELAAGSSKLQYISVNDHIGFPGPVGWDGKHFVIGMGGKRYGLVYRMAVLGSTGKIVGKTRFTGPQYRKSLYYTFWIQGHTIIVPYSTKKRLYGDDQLGLFDYPKGGVARKVIALYNGNVTVSVAPNR